MTNHVPPQIFLIDGYALIYRAFYALISRPLRTAKGENTSAAWGVTNFLLRLREKYRPDYVVWINDAGDSFREHCGEGTEGNRAQIKLHLENSLMLVTSLNGTIGYDNAAKIAKAAWQNGTTLREEALKSGLIDAKKFDEVVRPEKMIGPE